MTAAAIERIVRRQPMAGLLISPQRLSIGKAVDDLLLVWVASEAEEWIDRIDYLPL